MTIKELDVPVISRRVKGMLLFTVLTSVIAAVFVLWVAYLGCTTMLEKLNKVSREAAFVYGDEIIKQIIIWPIYVSIMLLVLIIVMCVKSHQCKNLLRNRKDAKLSWDYYYNTFVLQSPSKSIKFKAAFSVSDSVERYTLVVQNFKVTLLIPLRLLPEFKILFDDVRGLNRI